MEYYKEKPLKARLIQIAVLSFIMYIVAVVPFFVKRGLPFFYYGDYNVQQIPFYIQAHRAIRNGEFFWNWNIDLGGSMIGDFSFYLLGSPFFWITVPFPESFIPYMMPFLMALKYALGAAFAYLFIRRWVVRDDSAMIGALLYAFSGFNACNIVFNHFTDVVAFFPLYLYTFDMLMDIDHHKDHYQFIPAGRRFVFFSLMTAFMGVINYYFFFGQVVFFIIYFLCVYVQGNRPSVVFRMFLRALAGGCLGVLIAGFYLFQAALAVMGNSRLSNVLLGYDSVSYPSMNMLWDILKSMVMIPDIIGKGTVFYTSTVKNSSLAVYLPLFGLAGVVAYFLTHKLKKDGIKRLLLVCLIFSMIPILNASFSMFNEYYYARWFYMPILFMSLCSAKMIERGSSRALKLGTLVTSFLFLFVIVVGILPDYDSDGNIMKLSLIENEKIFWRDVVGTAIFTVALIVLVFAFPKCIRKIKLFKKEFVFKKPFMRLTAVLFAVIISATASLHICLKNGSSLISDYGKEQWEIQMLNTKPEGLSTDFYRGETDSTATNYDMVWGNGSLHSFISTIPGEIFDFYKGSENIERSVETKIPDDRIGVRAITSTRYYMENSLINKEGIFNENGGISGYYFKETQNGIDIYENINCIPMGFTYDYFMTESEFDELTDEVLKDRLLSVALIVRDEDEDDYLEVMDKLPSGYKELTLPDELFENNCNDRKKSACVSFKTSTDGFKAQTCNLEKESYVFFSVPNAKGFKAYVDGEETEILTADYGLMAIRVGDGVRQIEVKYLPQGFYFGLFCSILGILILIIYGALTTGKRR